MDKSIKLIILTILLFVQCKTNNVGQSTDSVSESTPVILLLQKGFSPTDLEALKEVQIESMKLTSRSQNVWLVKVKEEKNEIEKLLAKLKEDEKVSRAALEVKSKESDSFKNTKSGTTGPIKN